MGSRKPIRKNQFLKISVHSTIPSLTGCVLSASLWKQFHLICSFFSCYRGRNLSKWGVCHEKSCCFVLGSIWRPGPLRRSECGKNRGICDAERCQTVPSGRGSVAGCNHPRIFVTSKRTSGKCNPARYGDGLVRGGC